VRIYLDQFIPAGSARPTSVDDPSFDKYFAFLLDHAKRVDESKNINSKTTRDVSMGETTPTSKLIPADPVILLPDSSSDYTVGRIPQEIWAKMPFDQKKRFHKERRARERRNGNCTNDSTNTNRQVNQAQTSPDDSLL